MTQSANNDVAATQSCPYPNASGATQSRGKLGDGGIGVIYAAYDERLDRTDAPTPLAT